MDKLKEIRIGKKHVFGLFEDKDGIKHLEEIGIMFKDYGNHDIKIQGVLKTSLKSEYRENLKAYKRAEKDVDKETMRARAHDMAKIADAMEGEQ